MSQSCDGMVTPAGAGEGSPNVEAEEQSGVLCVCNIPTVTNHRGAARCEPSHEEVVSGVIHISACAG